MCSSVLQCVYRYGSCERVSSWCVAESHVTARCAHCTRVHRSRMWKPNGQVTPELWNPHVLLYCCTFRTFRHSVQQCATGQQYMGILQLGIPHIPPFRNASTPGSILSNLTRYESRCVWIIPHRPRASGWHGRPREPNSTKLVRQNSRLNWSPIGVSLLKFGSRRRL